MIRYDRLWATMEAQGMTQYRLIKHYNFSAGQIGRLKKNMHVSTHTLDTLCTLLGCDISDIIEYIPEGSPAPEEPPVPEAGSAEKETSSKSRILSGPSVSMAAFTLAAGMALPTRYILGLRAAVSITLWLTSGSPAPPICTIRNLVSGNALAARSARIGSVKSG